jgi:hypothetical protein
VTAPIWAACIQTVSVIIAVIALLHTVRSEVSCTERSNGDQENEQRFPLRGHSLSARALSRYFFDEGTTTYTHTSPISTRPTATKVIPTTWRETANHSGGADYRREGRPILAGFACAVNPGGLSGSLRAGG